MTGVIASSTARCAVDGKRCRIQVALSPSRAFICDGSLRRDRQASLNVERAPMSALEDSAGMEFIHSIEVVSVRSTGDKERSNREQERDPHHLTDSCESIAFRDAR